MDKKLKKQLEKMINNPEASDRIKFNAEILLLFDKYDPVNPDVSMDIEEFLGVLDKEKNALFFHYLMSVDQHDDIPFWERQ